MFMFRNLIATLLISAFVTVSAFTQDLNYSEWYLQRNDVDIYIREVGKGTDPVIVVHGGFGANHDYMLDAIKGLEDDFKFFLYDQRGSLLSPTAKENLTFPKNVEDLRGLVKALGDKKTKFLCHSMGTLVCMEFAKTNPQLVSKLVLTASLPTKAVSQDDVFSERYKNQIRYLQNRKEVKDLLQTFIDKGANNLKSIEDIENSQLTHKQLTEYWRVQFASVNIYNVKDYNLLKGGRGYYKGQAGVMVETVDWNYDYRPSLSENGKTTIIQGDHDFLDFNGEKYTEQLKDFPKIKLQIIKEAGHNVWLDNPALFKQMLIEALTIES